MPKTAPSRVRIGEFELNLDTGELSGKSQTVQLGEKPLRILVTLIENRGQLVTRDELQRRLWPNDTVVDFEHGINTAIKLLRKILGDSSDAPRYVETVPRRGYRILAPVEWINGRSDQEAFGANADTKPRAVRSGGMTGKVVSHYRVLDLIGGGGMGVVYRAEDLKLGRIVALKFLSEELGDDPAALERFHREARAISSLDHPNICPIYEFGEHAGLPFLVMPLLQGRILRDRLAESVARREAFPLEELLSVGLDIITGLQAAHEKGIIHRDIKPANVFLTDHGHAKILDFGVAKVKQTPATPSPAAEIPAEPFAGSGSDLTSPRSCLGTYPYMSPEQAAGKELDARTDLFSFGVILCEMATGSLAFSGGDSAGVFKAIAEGKPVSLNLPDSDTTPELERIIRKASEKDRALRYQSAAEMRADLSRLKRDSGRQTLAPTQTTIPVPSAARSRRIAVFATIGACAVVAVVLGWLWSSQHRRAQAAPPVKVSPLTSYPGIEQQPSLSPDGSQVAFSWNGPDQSNFDIYVKTTSSNTLSTTPLRLTTNPGDDIDPAWSPDGGSIAFLRKINAANAFSVLLMSALGGPERKLADVSIPEVFWLHSPYLSWMPNSKNLVITDRPSVEHPTALYSLSIATGEKRQLTFPPAGVMGDSCAAVSPDGKMLAFRRANAPGTWKASHYLLRLDANSNPLGEPAPISLERPIDANNLDKWSCATWTADSRRLLFSYDLGLWTLPVSISEENSPQDKATLAVETGSEITGATVSRTSTRLAYALRTGGGINIWRLLIPAAHERPQPPRRFIASTKSDFAEQYSPDGTKIAFETDRGGNLEIWLCVSNGQDCAQLTQMGASATGIPAWSPDGKRIAFYSNASGTSQIYVMPATGGAPLRLTSEPTGTMAPRWSHNGEWIYFSSKKGGPSQIWKVRSTGGEPRQVTHGAGLFCAESPDGKWLYFAGENSIASLWRVPVNGGQEEMVLPSVSAWNFAVMDDGIYFLTKTPQGFAIEFLTFATGKTAVIAAVDEGYFGFSVSPDRKFILYCQNIPMSSQLFLADGFK
jgi:Tol biopolymer transport system component/DNA-binding winged helix-turn-helix (wHTH) protein